MIGPDSICIELSGSISDGLWSAERNESRWAQNLGAVLGAAGLPVVMYGSWSPWDGPFGIGPRIPGVEFLSSADLAGRDYRVMVDFAHGCDKPVLGNPRHVVRGYFTADGTAQDMDWPPNHHFVYPHHLLPLRNARRESRLLQIPVLDLAWWDRYMPVPTPWPERRGIIFGVKPSERSGGPHAEWERILLDTARKLGEPATILWGRYYLPEHKALFPDRPREFGVLPWGLVHALQREAVLCFDPPWSGQFPMECVLEGCLPLFWRGGYYGIWHAAERVDPSVVLDPYRPDAEGFLRLATRLLSDADLRRRLLDACRDDLVPTGPEAVLRSWREVEAWIGP